MASAMRWRKGVITILLGSGGNSPPPRLHLNAHARKHHAKKTAMAASEDQPSRSGLVQRCTTEVRRARYLTFSFEGQLRRTLTGSSRLVPDIEFAELPSPEPTLTLTARTSAMWR